MSDTPRTVTIRYTIGAAVITFLVSGVGGAFLQSYLSRSRPEILVESVGFSGPFAGIVEVPDSLLSATDRSLFVSRPKKFEDFDQLVATEEEARTKIEELHQLSATIEQWNAKYTSSSNLALTDLRGNPLVKDYGETCKKIVEHLVTTGSLSPLPVNVLQLRPAKPIFEPVLEVPQKPGDSAQLRLSASDVVTRFIILSTYDPGQRSNVEAIAKSVAFGVQPNILYIGSKIQEVANRETLLLQEVSRSLQAAILPNARLTAKVSIYNGGGQATALKPYFALSFLRARNPVTIVLSTTEVDPMTQFAKMLPLSIRGSLTQSHSSEVKVDTFLPSSGTSSYHSIPPGQEVTVELISTDPLKDNGEALRAQYRTGLFDCQVVGQTTDGRRVASQRFQFGEHINDDDRKLVEGLIVK